MPERIERVAEYRSPRKKLRKRRMRPVTLGHVPARPKLTSDRQRHLLALIEFGEPVAAACRAVRVSRQTVHRHAAQDPIFAEALRAARARREPAPVVADWHDAAAFLEVEHPEHWALPTAPWDISDAG